MIKAVIFDIYGTLLKSEVGDLDDSLNQKDIQIKVIEKLNKKYNLNKNPIDILKKFKEEIKKEHEIKEKKGIRFPEIKIEDIWKKIIPNSVDSKSFSYDFYNLSGKRELYKKTKEILLELKSKNIKLGIISNAQFYTIKDLNRLLKINFDEIFDKKICYFSFETGYSKPNPESFLKIIDYLKKEMIEKEEIIYIGNNAKKDIETGNKIGIKTCLFESNEVKHTEGIIPDFKIKKLKELLSII